MANITYYEDHGGRCCGRYCAGCVACVGELCSRDISMACPCGSSIVANISVQNGGGIIVPRQQVLERIEDILRRHPDLISFDPLDDSYERVVMRCKTDPGPAHAERDGWEGLVSDWYFGSYTMTDEHTGELITLPSLSLITTDGRLIRLTNSEPAVRSWLVILREIGVERCRRGINVRVSLRVSQTAGRHYWMILPA